MQYGVIKVKEDTDPTRIKLRALMFAWYGAFKTIPSTCKEAVAKANATLRDENGDEVPADDVLKDVLTDHFADGRKGGISSRYLGEFLSKNKGRIECGARFEVVGKAHQAQLWRVKVTDPRRFESAKGELGELGESFLLEPEKLAKNFSDKDSSGCAENSSAENNSASFLSRGRIDSPDSPNSPKPRAAPPADDLSSHESPTDDANKLLGALKRNRGWATADELVRKTGLGSEERVAVAAWKLKELGLAEIEDGKVRWVAWPDHAGVQP